ncbi:hypothetical protein GCM10026982_24750 [Nocardiopsis aegyptia]
MSGTGHAQPPATPKARMHTFNPLSLRTNGLKRYESGLPQPEGVRGTRFRSRGPQGVYPGQSEERAAAPKKHRGEGRAGACRRSLCRQRACEPGSSDDEGPGVKRPEPTPA